MAILTLFSLSLLAVTAQISEPKSGQSLLHTISHDGRELMLTGADVRKVAGTIVYAIAHYAESDARPQDATAAAWIDAPCAKAFVLLGTRKVPARGIRWSWGNSLERVGYTGPNAESFVNAFSKGFAKDSRLELIATPEGRLTATQDGDQIGSWEDPDLVRAVWAVSLGESSEVHDPARLLDRSHLKTSEGAS